VMVGVGVGVHVSGPQGVGVNVGVGVGVHVSGPQGVGVNVVVTVGVGVGVHVSGPQGVGVNVGVGVGVHVSGPQGVGVNVTVGVGVGVGVGVPSGFSAHVTVMTVRLLLFVPFGSIAPRFEPPVYMSVAWAWPPQSRSGKTPTSRHSTSTWRDLKVVASGASTWRAAGIRPTAWTSLQLGSGAVE